MNRNLSSLDQNRTNNFDIIRFTAASMVIYSHAYLVTRTFDHEPLNRFVGFLNLGSVAVYIFFAISGYLITKSIFQQKTLRDFVMARLLRIFPALAVSTFACAFVLGPLLTSLSLPNYFSSPEPYRFSFGIATLLNVDAKLPGVFEQNPYPLVVNAPLWTLKGEILMYIVVFLVGVIELSIKRKKIVLVQNIPLIIAVFIYLVSLRITGVYIFREGLPAITFFVLGMFVYALRSYISLRIRYMIILWAITVSFVVFKLPGYKGTVSLALIYSLFVLSYHPKLQLGNFSKYGDFSYGLYIYSFPIQQVLIAFNPAFTALEDFAIAYILVLPIAILSWRFIEKPALKLKKVAEERNQNQPHLYKIS